MTNAIARDDAARPGDLYPGPRDRYPSLRDLDPERFDKSPDLRAWHDLLTRVQVDPRFPIPLHVSVVECLIANHPQVRIRVVVTTTNARVTGPDDCERCILALGGAPTRCPHLDDPIDVGFFQWFPLRCSDAQRAAHVLDFFHHACAHELDEFVRIDGRLIRDPHGPATTASEYVEEPAITSQEMANSDSQHLQAWFDVASRIRIDPRFPISIPEITIVEYFARQENPRVRVRCILTTKDAAMTSERWIDVAGHQWFPLRVSNAQRADHLLDLLHQAIAHELNECARVDGRLIRDPHAGNDPRR